MGESLGSHSLHSFAEFLQHHVHSPEANSCLTSKQKPFTILKPFCLNTMANEKSMRKEGRQRRGEMSKDLPDDLHELYKTGTNSLHMSECLRTMRSMSSKLIYLQNLLRMHMTSSPSLAP